MSKKPSIQTVTSVKTQEGRIYVTTREARPGVEETMIPMVNSVPWMQVVPEQGDLVEVYELDDGSRIARFTHSTDQEVKNGNHTAPSLSQRELSIKLDSSTKIQISGDGSGGYNVDISGSGDVTIDGTSIDLGPNGKTLVTDVVTNSDGTVSSIEKTTKTSAE